MYRLRDLAKWQFRVAVSSLADFFRARSTWAHVSLGKREDPNNPVHYKGYGLGQGQGHGPHQQIQNLPIRAIFHRVNHLENQMSQRADLHTNTDIGGTLILPVPFMARRSIPLVVALRSLDPHTDIEMPPSTSAPCAASLTFTAASSR